MAILSTKCDLDNDTACASNPRGLPGDDTGSVDAFPSPGHYLRNQREAIRVSTDACPGASDL
jgi:hypothetical protein